MRGFHASTAGRVAVPCLGGGSRVATFFRLDPGTGRIRQLCFDRALGMVPVEEDGAALFTVPASTPVSLQPLDADGKALALMRSWMTAMPGEQLSCVGCHDGSRPEVTNARFRRFKPYHQVHNVGFRVVIPDSASAAGGS